MRKILNKMCIMLLTLVLTLTMFAPLTALAEETQSSSSSTVTITFNPNGGSGGGTRWLTPGQQFGTLPTANRANHVFLGWFTSSTGGQQIQPTDLVPHNDATYWAHWGQMQSKTLSHTGSMMIMGMPPLTTNSNWISFNGNTIPANSIITSISVNTGSSTMSGVIMGNNLQILSSAGGNTLVIPWNGANNSVLNDSTHFTGLPARATYTIRWNGTVISGTPGNIFNPNPTDAIRGYSNVKLTINYIVMP